MEILTSVKNPKVLAWRSLKEKKGREEHRAFLAEGVRFVQEALASGFQVRAILLREGFTSPYALPDNAPLYVLSETAFGTVCDTRTPQGIAAVVGMETCSAEGNHLLALDGVQDPGNLGTILRTADAAGLDGVLLSRECADLFSPKVLRATMGSIFRLGFSFPECLPEALANLKTEGYAILSSQLDGEPFFERQHVGDRYVLIIGNEGAGVSDAVKAVATHRLRLPMRGGAESLNAAVAAGIMMYDLTRETGSRVTTQP